MPPPLVVGRFEDLIALAAQKRDLGVKLALERDVRLVRCEDGRLEIGLRTERRENAGERSGAQVLAMDQPALDGRGVGRAGPADGQIAERGRQAELKTGVRADPLVQAVLARFPGAEIVDVRKGEMPAVPQERRRPRGAEPASMIRRIPPSMTTSVRPMRTTIFSDGDFAAEACGTGD